MRHSTFAGPAYALLAGIGLAACGGGALLTEPVAEGAARVTSAATGVYELSFYQSTQNGLVAVSTLPVCSPTTCTELVLGAHVATTGGVPATNGSVVFQYCSYKGGPANDINRADEAPSADCASGLASWANLRLTLTLNASGNAYMSFGVVQIPRTVGFRFKYSARGGGNVASGVSLPRDFTWTAQ